MKTSRFVLIVMPFLAVAAVIATTPAPSPSQDAATAYQAVDVADGVVMAVHAQGSNITCISHGGGLVFVDAGLSTKLAARFRSDMERRFALPTRALVLTHAHLDHVLGMGAFADVPVVAAAAGRPFLERLTAFTWDESSIAATTQVFPTFADVIGDAKPFLPTVWFDDEHQLGTAVDPLLVRRTGGHSACSSHVWWPKTKLVVTGDLVQARRRPYFGDGATDLKAWMSALQRWQDDGVARFCPGHGPVIGGDEVAQIRGYFVELTKALTALKARGVTLDAAIADPSLPPGYWPAGDTAPRWWPACIAAAYGGV